MELLDTKIVSGNGSGDAGRSSEPAALPQLNVTGLVVNKADLLAVLRTWVPQLTDFKYVGDQRFLLELQQA